MAKLLKDFSNKIYCSEHGSQHITVEVIQLGPYDFQGVSRRFQSVATCQRCGEKYYDEIRT